jgi:hypothetical protein
MLTRLPEIRQYWSDMVGRWLVGRFVVAKKRLKPCLPDAPGVTTNHQPANYQLPTTN